MKSLSPSSFKLWARWRSKISRVLRLGDVRLRDAGRPARSSTHSAEYLGVGIGWLSWLFPKRCVIIVGESSIRLYRFRFGRLIGCELLSPHEVSSQRGDVLLDTLPQELYVGTAPKLKFFDRKPFLYHVLSSHFKTVKWLAYLWFPDHAYLALKLEQGRGSVLSSLEEGRTCGALVGELLRLNIFKEGEGLILAPSQDGKVREIYLKNHRPVFIRLVDAREIERDWEKEIDALKRYFERHHQANPQTLRMIWWGPACPSQKLTPYASTFLEEDLARNYARFLAPALTYHPVFSPHLFCRRVSVRILTLLFSLSSVCLVALSFLLFKESRQNEEICLLTANTLKEKQKELDQVKGHLESQFKAIDPEWDIASVVDVYEKLAPLASLAVSLSWFQRISGHVKRECRVHEFFWGRGQMTIHPKDQSISFQPLSFESLSESVSGAQGLVLGVTGPSVERLQLLEKTLRKGLSPAHVELWESQEMGRGGQKTVSGLIQIQHDSNDDGNNGSCDAR